MQTFKLVLLSALIIGYGVALQAGVMPDEFSQTPMQSAAIQPLSALEAVDVVQPKGLWQGLLEFVMLATLFIL